jgi:hypothetical protein
VLSAALLLNICDAACVVPLQQGCQFSQQQHLQTQLLTELLTRLTCRQLRLQQQTRPLQQRRLQRFLCAGDLAGRSLLTAPTTHCRHRQLAPDTLKQWIIGQKPAMWLMA